MIKINNLENHIELINDNINNITNAIIFDITLATGAAIVLASESIIP